MLYNIFNYKKYSFILFALIISSNCGFTPLYSEANVKASNQFTSSLVITPIPERAGQVLTTELNKILNIPNKVISPLYTLDINIKVEKKPVAFKLDKTVTRFNVILNSSYTLSNNKTRDKLFNESIRSIAAYSVVLSEFANITAEKDAEIRVLKDTSRQIALRLATYFSKNVSN